MTIRDAECILSIATHKSISKAAEEVFVTQQALSKTLQRVESELQVSLFFRTSSGVEITDIGLKLIPVFSSLLSNYQEHITIINDIIKNNKQQISISCEHSFLSSLFPAEVLSQFKEFEIKITIAHTLEKCIEDVKIGKADLGFCHKQDHFTELQYQYEPVLDEDAYVIMHKDNPLCTKKELTLSDLKNVPILNSFIDGTPSKIFINACINEGFYPNIVLTSDNLKILLSNIHSNTGVLLFSRYFVSAGSDDIICIPLKHKIIKMDIGFITLPEVSKTISFFIKVFQGFYGKAPV